MSYSKEAYCKKLICACFLHFSCQTSFLEHFPNIGVSVCKDIIPLLVYDGFFVTFRLQISAFVSYDTPWDVIPTMSMQVLQNQHFSTTQ